jgi:hypothetical protein
MSLTQVRTVPVYDNKISTLKQTFPSVKLRVGNELTRGPSELLQHFGLQRDFTFDPKMIWFGYISGLSQWGGGV